MVARYPVAPVRGLTMAFFLANLAMGLMSWKLILPPPMVLCAAVTVALGAAWAAAGRESA